MNSKIFTKAVLKDKDTNFDILYKREINSYAFLDLSQKEFEKMGNG